MKAKILKKSFTILCSIVYSSNILVSLSLKRDALQNSKCDQIWKLMIDHTIIQVLNFDFVHYLIT